MRLIEVPRNAGGHVVVQASGVELPGDLQLASARPGSAAGGE